MPKLSDDDWPVNDPALASLAEDLRILTGGPAPEPRPGLLAVMRQGVVDPVRTPQGSRKMLVKTVIGSLAAKVALGMGVAAASVTAAGAAGVLPDPAQRAVASVVGAATPFALPDPTTDVLQVVGDDTTTTTSTTVLGTTTTLPTTSTTLGTGTTLPGTGTVDDGDDEGTGDEPRNHGACVSAIAKDKSGSDGASHGKAVSTVARSDCGKTGTTATTVAPSTTTSSTTPTTVGSAATQRTGNSGPGNANGGQGNGNGGQGNSGKK